MNTTTNTIHEVLEYGSIVAHDEELDILITVNGAYFNWWNGNGDGGYVCSECFAVESEQFGGKNGLYGCDIVKITERAEQIIKEQIEIINED